MTTAPEAGDVGVMRRLHPLSLFYSVGSAASRLLWPGLVALLWARGERYPLWLMVMFVPAGIAALASYLSYRYRLGEEELVVREGIITRNERHIPYSRIQNIDLKQGPVQRWLGVAEVRVETASGEKPEAVMRVLSLDAVETMRDRVFGRHRTEGVSAGPAAAPDDVLFRLTLRDLLLLGLISNRGLAVIAAALGLLFQRIDFDEAWVRDALARAELPPALAHPGPVATALLALGALLVVMLLLVMLSMAWTVVKLYGFALLRRDEDLRASYGLWSHITATIPLRRIQLLSIRRGALHRLFGLASVQVETAGQSRGDSDAAGVERLWLAPMIDDRRVPELVAEALPGIDLSTLDWKPVAARAARRVIKRTVLVALIVSGLAALAFEVWALTLLFPGILLAWLHARLYVRYTGYALLPDAVVFRSGWWTRRTSIVPYAKIQALSLEESPFDRRTSMASVRVDTAGAGRVGHRMELRYLDAPVAAAMAARLAHETGGRPFQW